jgi:hypothetical protein
VIDEPDDPVGHRHESALEPCLIRHHVHQAILRAEPARADECDLNPRTPDLLLGDFADHRGAARPNGPARHHHRDARALGQHLGRPEPVRHDE